MTIHPHWLRDKPLPYNVLRCPVCGRTRTHRVNAWWYDDDAGTWRCRAGECGERFHSKGKAA
jgi:transcriptional regulator NrdR family protein